MAITVKKKDLADIVRKGRIKEQHKAKYHSVFYEKLMTVKLLDKSKITFDCFYERMFFTLWYSGMKPSFSVYITHLEQLVIDGWIENRDLGWLFDYVDDPSEFMKIMLMKDHEWYPTTSIMDRSYIRFKELLQKGLVEIKYNVQKTSCDVRPYHEVYFQFFDDANGKFTYEVYENIMYKYRKSSVPPTLDWLKDCYRKYVDSRPDIVLSDDELYALTLDVWSFDDKKFDPVIGYNDYHGYTSCRYAAKAYNNIRKLGIVGLNSDDISRPGDGASYQRDGYTVHRTYNNWVCHNFNVSLADIMRAGEIVHNCVRLKNTYDTNNINRFFDVIYEWNRLEHSPLVQRNVALQMTHHEYVNYGGDIDGHCRKLVCEFIEYVRSTGSYNHFERWGDMEHSFGKFGVSIKFNSVCDQATRRSKEQAEALRSYCPKTVSGRPLRLFTPDLYDAYHGNLAGCGLLVIT